jgi:hypothetical protein
VCNGPTTLAGKNGGVTGREKTKFQNKGKRLAIPIILQLFLAVINS